MSAITPVRTAQPRFEVVFSRRSAGVVEEYRCNDEYGCAWVRVPDPATAKTCACCGNELEKMSDSRHLIVFCRTCEPEKAQSSWEHPWL